VVVLAVEVEAVSDRGALVSERPVALPGAVAVAGAARFFSSCMSAECFSSEIRGERNDQRTNGDSAGFLVDVKDLLGGVGVELVHPGVSACCFTTWERCVARKTT
jgi:hypothetical protein